MKKAALTFGALAAISFGALSIPPIGPVKAEPGLLQGLLMVTYWVSIPACLVLLVVLGIRAISPR